MEELSLDSEIESLRTQLLARDRELEDSRVALDRLRLEQALEIDRIREHANEVRMVSHQQLEDLVAQRTARLSLEIARRKEAERALRWSLDEIQDLYDHAPCGYHSLDAEGRYLRVNQTELDWLGSTREDLLGTRFADLVDPSSREFYSEQEAVLAMRGEVSDVQLCLTTREGKHLTILLSASTAQPLGEPRVTRAMFVDVTARHAAEKELRKHVSIIDAVLEGTTDAVFVKDLAGRYVMINSAGARFLGKDAKDVVGRDDTELFSPDSARSIREGDLRVIEAGFAKTYEEYGTSAGFRRLYHTMKGPYRDPQGNVIGLIGISRLISETPVDATWGT